MIASPTNSKMREFVGHRLGEIYEGNMEIDPRNPKPFTIKQHLKENAGPFAGFEAEFGYTVKNRQLAYIKIFTTYDLRDEIEQSLVSKMLYGYYGISGTQHEKVRALVKPKALDINPYGVRLNGTIYGRGTYGTGTDRHYKHKEYACVADIKLLNELDDELIEIQDAAITKHKLSTESSTLQSFCGIRFGTRDSDVGGTSTVIIDGEEYQMPRTTMKCNKFRAFKDHADVWTSRSGNVFLIHVEQGIGQSEWSVTVL